MCVSIAQMPAKRGADDDDYVPTGGAARGAKKHPVSEAVLRFATEKKGAKAGPFVNKIFESSLEGAEQKVQQLEEADAASPVSCEPLTIIADCLMMIVACSAQWCFARPFSPDSRVNVIRAPHSPHSSRARARTGTP